MDWVNVVVWFLVGFHDSHLWPFDIFLFDLQEMKIFHGKKAIPFWKKCPRHLQSILWHFFQVHSQCRILPNWSNVQGCSEIFIGQCWGHSQHLYFSSTALIADLCWSILAHNFDWLRWILSNQPKHYRNFSVVITTAHAYSMHFRIKGLVWQLPKNWL